MVAILDDDDVDNDVCVGEFFCEGGDGIPTEGDLVADFTVAWLQWRRYHPFNSDGCAIAVVVVVVVVIGFCGHFQPARYVMVVSGPYIMLLFRSMAVAMAKLMVRRQ